MISGSIELLRSFLSVGVISPRRGETIVRERCQELSTVLEARVCKIEVMKLEQRDLSTLSAHVYSPLLPFSSPYAAVPSLPDNACDIWVTSVSTVRLPQLLAQSALTPAEITQVQKLLGDFLRFMQKNHATFFVQEYEDEEPVSQLWLSVWAFVITSASRSDMLNMPSAAPAVYLALEGSVCVSERSKDGDLVFTPIDR